MQTGQQARPGMSGPGMPGAGMVPSGSMSMRLGSGISAGSFQGPLGMNQPQGPGGHPGPGSAMGGPAPGIRPPGAPQQGQRPPVPPGPLPQGMGPPMAMGSRAGLMPPGRPGQLMTQPGGLQAVAPGGPSGGMMGGPPGGMMGVPSGGMMGGPPGMMGGPPGGMMGGPPGGMMGGPPGGMMGGPPGGMMGQQRATSPQPGGKMMGQPGEPDTGGPVQPKGMPHDKRVVHHLAKPRRSKGLVEDDLSEREFGDGISSRGGLTTFKDLVIVGEHGNLGAWTGYEWKSRRVAGTFFRKIVHDNEGRLWCITDQLEVGKLTQQGFRSLGLLGSEYLVDIAFDPRDSSLWAVSRIGELLHWGGFSFHRKGQNGFHKVKAISFDGIGNLWAVNTACELAIWHDDQQQWEVKGVPGALRIQALAFDKDSHLWVVGPEGQLYVLAGRKWVNYGHVACWKIRDLSFRPSKQTGADVRLMT